MMIKIRELVRLIDLAKNKEGGFTLLELLIVIIIVGILSAIALPSLLAQVEKARYAEAKIQMSAIAKELEAHRLEKGYFPPDVQPDIKPDGINYFPLRSDGDVPFDSRYDYESWNVGGGNQCYIQITFFGKNTQRNSPTEREIYSEPGIYEHPDGDDLLFVLGTYDQSCE
ncbi:MAG: prepilin-type N-terminal cleavage/methylation domain-containing protein [Halothece sp.]